MSGPDVGRRPSHPQLFTQGDYAYRPRPRKREETAVSLHPLSFEEAIRELVKPPKRKDSEVGESGNTTEPAPESGTSKKLTARRRKSSGG